MTRLSIDAANRRREKQERVTAVKALGIKPGDWISTGRDRIIRATESILDSRKVAFQWLRRATPKEIVEKEAEETKRKLQWAKQEAYDNRPDVRNAGYILSHDTETLVKLDPEFLAEIVQRLEAIKKGK